MKKSLGIPAMFALLLSFGSSHAAGYIGASVGSTSPDEDGFDDSDGNRITFGYQASPNLAIEASLTNLGDFDADDDLVAAVGILTGVAVDSVSVEVDGIEFAMLGSAPISDVVSIFGKVGVFLWDAEFKIDTVSFGSDTDTDDGSDLFFGAGVSFNIGPVVALNLEYLLYEASDADIDYVGAGLNLKF